MTIFRSNSAASCDRGAEFGRVLGLRDADARAEVRGFHEHREAELGRDRSEHRVLVPLPVALQHDVVVADRKALRGEHELHRRLVHPDGRRQDAGADVRHIGELEQPLDRSVFAVRAVQHGKHDVEPEAGHGRLRCITPIDGQERVATGMRDEMRFLRGRVDTIGDAGDHVGGLHHVGRAARQRPASVLLDPDRHGFVARRIQVLKDRGRRRQRHFVFARSAAVDDADAQFFHSTKLSTCPSVSV